MARYIFSVICNLKSQREPKYCKIDKTFYVDNFSLVIPCLMMSLYMSRNMYHNNKYMENVPIDGVFSILVYKSIIKLSAVTC